MIHRTKALRPITTGLPEVFDSLVFPLSVASDVGDFVEVCSVTNGSWSWWDFRVFSGGKEVFDGSGFSTADEALEEAKTKFSEWKADNGVL